MEDAEFESFKEELEAHRVELKDIVGQEVVFNPNFDWNRFHKAKKRLGFFGCPCQENAPCPCADHVQDLLDNDSCYCGLFKISHLENNDINIKPEG
jgi:hypothetical protein